MASAALSVIAPALGDRQEYLRSRDRLRAKSGRFSRLSRIVGGSELSFRSSPCTDAAHPLQLIPFADHGGLTAADGDPEPYLDPAPAVLGEQQGRDDLPDTLVVASCSTTRL